ncbi:MAG: VCBS repeat-containing protein [Bacteroidaceae bacterium]|nr:VCBS repeat-containing protein [Bacteroidaceae bacterium]
MKRLFTIALSFILGASLFADNELLVGNVDMSVSVDQIGGASITIPIEVPAGVNGMQPDLALVYNSHGGYGIAGWGWDLVGISSIQRTGKTIFHDNVIEGIKRDDTDNLILNGERLLLKSGDNLAENSTYRTEHEGFNQITMEEGQRIIVKTKDGYTSIYGDTYESQLIYQYGLVKTWFLSEVTDKNGNCISYTYNYNWGSNINDTYISKIEYAGKENGTFALSVEFEYVDIPHERFSYDGNTRFSRTRILKSIKVKNLGTLLYTYSLTYDNTDVHSKLVSVKKIAANGDYYNPTNIVWNIAGTASEKTVSVSISRKDNLLFADFTGDGLTDIFSYNSEEKNCVFYTNTSSESGVSYTASSISVGKDFKILKVLDFNGDGRKDLAGIYDNTKITYLISNGTGFTTTSNYIDASESDFSVGDFDGDGCDEIIPVGANQMYNYNASTIAFTGITTWFNSNGHIYTTTPNNAPLDFNGNGKTDLLILTDVYYYIYEFNESTSTFQQIGLGLLNDLVDNFFAFSKIRFGDFNGDGCSDLLHLGFESSNNLQIVARIFVSRGGRLVEEQKQYIGYPEIFVNDFNNDGISDIAYLAKVNNVAHLYVGINNCDDFVIHDQTFSMPPSEFNTFFFEDIYGTGRADFVMINNENKNKITTKQVFTGNSLLVDKVTDGMGNVYDFTYKSITNSNVYTNTRTGANHVLPLVQPFYVVSDYTAPYTSLSYHYKNGRYHTQGKGLFGFEEVTTTDNLNQTKKKDVCSITTAHLHYYPYSTTTTTLSGDTISYLKYRYTVRDMGGKCIFAHHAGYEYTDYLTGLKEVCVSNYDNNGNLDNETKTRGDWQEKSQFQYVNVGSWCPNKLSNSLTYNVYNGSTSPYRRTFYKYDSRGNMIRQTIDTLYTDTYRLVNQYEYDDFGNIIKETISGSGQTRTKSYTYSSDGRLMLTATDEYGHLTTYAYDPVTTLVSSVTTPAGTTSYTYDAFGRNIQTVYPDGVITTSTLQYASPISNVKYKTIETTTNKPTITTYHASDGKPLYVERTAFNNKLTYTAYAYHLNGAEKMVSSPYFSTNVTAAATQAFSSENATYYNYDRYRRPSRMESPEGITLYSYDGLNTTIITPTISKTTKLNSSGFAEYEQIGVALTPLEVRTPSYQDVYKKVSYTYYPTGQVKTATPDGGSAVTMQYDVQGNRTKLIDPDAGTITNTYNAFGQVLTRSQNIHGGTPVVTTLEYGASNGRLSKETIVGDTTTTTTYSYNSTFRDKPYRVVGKNKYATYAYDEYGNVTGYLRAYDSKYGRVATYYDKGLIVRNYLSYNGNGNLYYTYDNYGNMISEKYNSTVAWELLEQNARGQVVRERKGGVVTTYTYDNCGRVTSIVAPNIVSLHYTYDGDGNVLTKTDAINNQSIEYTYDHFMRLVSWTVNDNSTHSITYDATTGNIISKSDLGNATEFTYNSSSKPHALRGVNGILGDWGSSDVSIDYTDFGKVASVQQGTDSYNIIYGVEKERIYTQETLSGKTTTRYYMPNYEFVVDAFGNESCIIYLCNGSIAIYDETANTKTLYHGYYDAQGSLIALTDNSGNVLARYANDPWGKRVAAINWNYSPTYTPTLNIDRGYTMHEHLDEFGLINMNGRVYDPAVAQFLSPDPYIQDGGNWLNYNRYAYCYNNPTRYVDPDGEIVKTLVLDFFNTLFTGGLNFGNKEVRQNAWKKFDPTAPWSKTNKAMMITGGLFKTDPNKNVWGRTWQLFSRFTWELPQTVVGHVWSDIRNMSGQVDRVDYYGGATFVTNENSSSHNGVSLGSYININLPTSINDEFCNYIKKSPMFMHEYGHYIQSQYVGPRYFSVIGIPSLIQTIMNRGKYVEYNNHRVQRSRTAWMEVWANKLAADYFMNTEGVDWGIYEKNHPRKYFLYY